ncbi:MULTISPECIES: phage tail tube protein [unclassified Microbacterium]|uniref:phage tail tube protein n=1 Tax=unclassified Microbacterium TaxID=2609290 RepID=UPI0030183752
MARVLSKGRRKLTFVPKSAAATAALAVSVAKLNGAGVFDASDYALVDGFNLGFGEPVSADATPIGSSRTVNLMAEGDVNATINWLRDTVTANDKAWTFHLTPLTEFWAVLRNGPDLASKAWAVGDTVDVFDLYVTDPTDRPDAEVWSFAETYGQGSGHVRRATLVA